MGMRPEDRIVLREQSGTSRKIQRPLLVASNGITVMRETPNC